MTNIQTKESTLRALAQAARRPPSKEELRRQRLSFIMGSLNKDSHVTKARIQEILEEQEGSASAK